jgi:hypothetical protein
MWKYIKYAFATIWVLGYVLCCIFIPSLRPKAQPNIQLLTGDALINYFRNPENYKLENISKIIADVGPWQSYDDWDRGRLIYEWRGSDFRIRVLTQSGCVRCVEFLDPSDSSRFATALETVWEHKVSQF